MASPRVPRRVPAAADGRHLGADLDAARQRAACALPAGVHDAHAAPPAADGRVGSVLGRGVRRAERVRGALVDEDGAAASAGPARRRARGDEPRERPSHGRGIAGEPAVAAAEPCDGRRVPGLPDHLQHALRDVRVPHADDGTGLADRGRARAGRQAALQRWRHGQPPLALGGGHHRLCGGRAADVRRGAAARRPRVRHLGAAAARPRAAAARPRTGRPGRRRRGAGARGPGRPRRRCGELPWGAG